LNRCNFRVLQHNRSLADIQIPPARVRSIPETGRQWLPQPCLLRANNGSRHSTLSSHRRERAASVEW
jgi:hypothetical protein